MDNEFISIKEKLPSNHQVCEIVVDGQMLKPCMFLIDSNNNKWFAHDGKILYLFEENITCWRSFQSLIPMTVICYAPDFKEVLTIDMVRKYREEIERLAGDCSGDAHLLYDRLKTHFLHYVLFAGDGGESQGLADKILKIEEEVDIDFWYD